ncbi:MAG: hypothetical protein ACJ8JD_02830 [Chthoniobacterales bacterium]
MNLTVALMAFIATCVIIHAMLPLPLPQLGYVNQKLRFLAARRDDYDTIFIGSSRTFRGISPAVFDRTSAAAGRPHHSFNLGIDGMWPPEQFYILDALLKFQPHTWRWVFIELDDVQIDLPPELKNTERAVYWHDLPRTAQIFRKVLRADQQHSIAGISRRLWQRRNALVLHVRLFLQRIANVGRASSIFGDWFAEEAIDRRDYLGPDGDGHIPVDLQLSGERAEVYDRWLRRESSERQSHRLDRIADKAYRTYASRFARFGAKTAFFVTPASPSLLPSDFAQQPAPTLFIFNDPAKYPALYKLDARWDENHLNAIGAARFSQLFAETLLTVPQR